MPLVDKEYLKRCKEDAEAKTGKVESFESMRKKTMAAKHIPADLPKKPKK